MNKAAQFSSLYAPALAGKDLHDLFRELQRDASINQSERMQLIARIGTETGHVPASTPLSVLLSYGAGGVLGYLIAKYFGMGSAGRAVSSAIGAQLGRMVYDKHKKPDNGMPGWKLL